MFKAKIFVKGQTFKFNYSFSGSFKNAVIFYLNNSENCTGKSRNLDIKLFSQEKQRFPFAIVSQVGIKNTCSAAP